MRNAIVIGAGLAGLMGTLALAQKELRPLLLAKGQGTTHWTGGTIDVLGATAGSSLSDALQTLIDQQPDHPYARVGLAGVEEALGHFCEQMEAARYPYAGSLDGNILLPTALGALRPTALMPVTMVAGDVRLGSDMLIAGFHELRDFFPPMAAANLRAQGIAARGIYLQVPEIGRRLDYTPRTFANLFDDPAFRQQIGQQLREVRGGAARIGMPAVLGLRDPVGVVQELQQHSGAQIFEIPTLPPSVPGMRIFNILRDAITTAGGRMQIGSEVLRSAGEQDRLTTLYTEAAAREQEHRARTFLLASGGVAGGGIRTDYTGAVRETVLDLPLRAPDSCEHWFASRFFNEDGHPIFRAGIATDARLRPVDSSGSVVYQNVVVAGSALAGSDPVQERCVTGMALTTGWYAGQVVAEMLNKGA